MQALRFLVFPLLLLAFITQSRAQSTPRLTAPPPPPVSLATKLENSNIIYGNSVLSRQDLQQVEQALYSFVTSDQESVVTPQTYEAFVSQFKESFLVAPALNSPALKSLIHSTALSGLSQAGSLLYSTHKIFEKLKIPSYGACQAEIVKVNQALQFRLDYKGLYAADTLVSEVPALLENFIAGFHKLDDQSISIANMNIDLFDVKDYPLKGAPSAVDEVRKIRVCMSVPFLKNRCQTLKYKKLQLNPTLWGVLVSVGRTNGPSDPSSIWQSVKVNKFNEGVGLLLIKSHNNKLHSRFQLLSTPDETILADMSQYMGNFKEFLSNQEPSYDVGCRDAMSFEALPQPVPNTDLMNMQRLLAAEVDTARTKVKQICEGAIKKLVSVVDAEAAKQVEVLRPAVLAYVAQEKSHLSDMIKVLRQEIASNNCTYGEKSLCEEHLERAQLSASLHENIEDVPMMVYFRRCEQKVEHACMQVAMRVSAPGFTMPRQSLDRRCDFIALGGAESDIFRWAQSYGKIIDFK